MNAMLKKIREDMREAACVEKVSLLQRFFKTGPGEYGEGDVFVGLLRKQKSAPRGAFLFMRG